MWEFLTGFFLTQGVSRSRAIRLLALVFVLGALIAGLVYAALVSKAVSERRKSPHVHAHHAR